MEQTFTVVVRAVEEAADGVRTLWLARDDEGALPGWEPGAHIDLLLADGLERQYSLCGDPADLSAWRVAVLREPESRGGSAYVHERLAAGDTLQVRGPRNEFPLEGAERHLFIAGGIGITPLLPMIAALHARGADWRIVYGGRQRVSMAFLGELEQYDDRVTLWPQDELGLIDLPGLLDEPRTGTRVYCCGPGVLIDAVEAACAAWPAGSLHVERFRPKDGALDGPTTTFEVHLEASDLTLTVPADRSIAEVVEEAGVEIFTSCREGTCGTCETGVLKGVPDHRDSLLTEDEKAENDVMMICCSRSKTPLLVLDL
ncbi:PDR/VanB family oxidoreductase [Nocardioides panacihumi]|uniref:PDR/VanB family oxidoreductase n=1 Tax=Nocardioides panacihumi TaxID=400774 RepID=A0ABN2Q9V4_9ACTN